MNLCPCGKEDMNKYCSECGWNGDRFSTYFEYLKWKRDVLKVNLNEWINKKKE